MENQIRINKKRVSLAAIVCLAALMIMAAALALTKERKTEAFVPPTFDSSAEEGVPEVDASLGWMKVSQEGMSFCAYVCGEIIIENKKADVYFASAEENKVWLKLRVLNEEGDILGETGLIRPGEHVRSVTFDALPENGEAIGLKLMSYEPETYYSAGAVVLNTTAKIGG